MTIRWKEIKESNRGHHGLVYYRVMRKQNSPSSVGENPRVRMPISSTEWSAKVALVDTR
jgi:hypothetical protein